MGYSSYKKGKDGKPHMLYGMAKWVICNSEAFFRPMYEYFHRKLLERNFGMADVTPLQVLHEQEHCAQMKSCM